MKVTILGTGTSTGIPEIGCTCRVCTSKDVRDWRTRCSAWIETDEGKQILIDCSADFRMQMLKQPFRPIDALFLTHEHYDHVGGIDDLRPFCRDRSVPIYALPDVSRAIRTRIPYCFVKKKYPGVPSLELHEINPFQTIAVGTSEILPLAVIHGKLPILGYRIGRLAYITDMSALPQQSFEALKGITHLVMNALRIKPHPTHQCLQEALERIEQIKQIAPIEETYLIHISHGMGPHAEAEATLPPHVHLAYDGLTFEL